MSTLYTIGFGKKDARTFFDLLLCNNVQTLIDVRLNNTSQLAGFTKKNDLEYFLKTIGNIAYQHAIELTPTRELMDRYKNKKLTWEQYEEQYRKDIMEKKIENRYTEQELNRACLLCSEPTAQRCHRRLLAEYLQRQYSNMEIIHL